MNTSDATPSQNPTSQGIALESDYAARRRRVICLLIVVFIIAGVILSTLHLLRPTTKPDALPQTGSADISTDPPNSLPLPELRPAADAQAAARLDALEERTAALVQQVDTLSASLTGLGTTVTSLSDTAAQLRTRLDAQAQAPRPAVQRPAPAGSPAPPKPKLPAIVSVDIWGDQASVAIKDADGKLAFYREGDLVGLTRIQRIDPRTLQVHLRLPDGATTTIGVRD